MPPALLVWGTAVAGNWLNPAELALLCGGMAAAAAMLLVVTGRSHVGHSHVGRRTVGRARPGRGTLRYDPRHGAVAPRSFRATLAVALLLSVAAGAHAAVESSRRHDGAIAEAVAARAAVVAEVEVAGAPRRLRTPGASGLADRWAVPVTLKAVTFDGRRIAGDARFVVMGGAAWKHPVPGQQLRTTGRLRAAAPGEPDAGILSASSAPTVLRGPGVWQQAPGGLRRSFTAAAARFGGDAGGLLPGMVTGDTSALNAELEDAMKTVGMTHLTAVSGANCSLILGTLLLMARTLRLPRVAAAAASLAGLGLFVLMVGPDPSVLRAALMGGIGLASMASGRAGRGLSLLCVAVIGLLLVEPVLATSFGFVLSVLATLGIVITGRRIMDWIPAPVPRWAAGGVAVPLSAQLFCGPVIVLLQPQFGAYALPANVAAAALVAPVTLLGTAAAALLPVVPAAAELLMTPAAAFARAVAGTARFFAALPGAVLPWPEGGFGAATMGIFSATVLGMVWLALHPAAVVRSSLAAHAWTVAVLEGWPPAMRARGPSDGPGRPSGRLPGRARGTAWSTGPGMGRLESANQLPGGITSGCCPDPTAQDLGDEEHHLARCDTCGCRPGGRAGGLLGRAGHGPYPRAGPRGGTRRRSHPA
ncbi:competence protein ComEC [Arthrobacter sp. ok909]|nr:competence protein ComEC [Arthrobacter sp. ok909]